MLAPLRTLAAGLLVGLTALLVSPAASQDDAPYDKQVDGRPQRIERSASFRSIAFDRVQTADGLELYLQRLPRAKPDRNERLTDWYSDLARKVTSRLEREVLRPAGVVDALPRRPVAVVVLATEGDWRNYAANAGGQLCSIGAGAAYDEALCAVVTLDPETVGTKPRSFRTETFLHAYVHALLQAHAGCVDRAPRPWWLVEGLALWTASCADRTGKVVSDGWTLARRSEDLAARMQAGGHAAYRVLPLASMLSFEHRAEYRGQLPMPDDADDADEWWARERSLGMQAALLVDLLLDEARPARRAGFLDFVGRALAEERVTRRFGELCAVDDVAALEVELWTAIWANRDEARRGSLPEAVRAALASPPATTGAAPAAAEPLAVASGAAFAPRDAGSTLDRAAWLARTGHLAQARELLGGLAEDPDHGPRATREAGRLARTLAARDAWLAEAVREEGILRLEVEGKRKACRVVEWEGDRVVLRVGRKDLITRSLAELPLAAVGTAMGDTPEGCYLRGLAGEKRWERDLPEGHGDAQLVDDVAFLTERAAAGRLVDLLVRIEDPASAPAARLALLEELAGLGTELAPVLDVDALDALRATATATLQASFTTGHIAELLNATEAVVQDGRLHMVYEFDDPAELEDFVVEDPDGRGPVFPPAELRIPEADAGFDVRNGALKAIGKRGLRHKVRLGAPLELDSTISWGLHQEGDCEHFRQVLLFQEDRQCVNVENMHQRVTWFESYEWKARFTEAPSEAWPNRPVRVAFEVAADGAMKAMHEGEVVFEDKTDVLAPGDYVFCVYSDVVVSMLRLELTGTLDESSLGLLREDWVAARLESLGLMP